MLAATRKDIRARILFCVTNILQYQHFLRQYLHGKIDHETSASRIHNQAVDQMSVNGSNAYMKQTPQDGICTEPEN